MDSVTIVVTALVLGAGAGRQDAAPQTITVPYAGLKSLIQRKYPGISLSLLEAEPSSKARQAVIEEDLRTARAGADPELLEQAQRVLNAVEVQAPATNQVVGIALHDIKAASIELTSILAQSTGPTTGVAIQHADVTGDIRIGNVRAISGSPAPEKPSLTESETGKKTTILFLAANPVDTVRLRLDAEVRAIDAALQRTPFRHQFDLQQHWAVRVADLPELLQRHEPAIVHFSGHGSDAGELVLEDALGQMCPVASAALTRLFSVLRDNIRCVVLNACYSESQAQAIAESVGCVVGVSGQIGDEAAVGFAAAFYAALGYGRDIGTAFELGLTRIQLESANAAYTPVLLAPREGATQLRLAGNGTAFPKA